MIVSIFGEEQQVEQGMTLYDIVKQQSRQEDYVLAYQNGRLCELYKMVEEGDDIQFVSTKDPLGMLAYKRSMSLLMLKAFYEHYKKEKTRVVIKHSINQAYFCVIQGKPIEEVQKVLPQIEKKMREMVEKALPIRKQTIRTSEAIKRFHEYGMFAKEKLFRYRRGSRMNLYELDGYEEYFYGYMVPTTECLKYFELEAYQDGFLLKMPSYKNPKQVAEFVKRPKLFQTLKEADQWGSTLEIDTVGALNDAIVAGRMNDIILIQEALQEKKISNIADEIIKNNKRIVLIAGPSSSGKTTFSHRLSIQLKVHGRNPHPIPMDDYFKNREETPRDENGEYDYEVLEAIDVELFQQNMTDLLEGKSILLPKFDFIQGRRKHRGEALQISDRDILIIEGIHGLNKKLSDQMPQDSIYKIYISPLTQINLDEHNRVPTTDARLLRRLIRDAAHRGTIAKDTIARWHSVRRGEESYIFPYQEEADVMFNSALIYELAVLKQYAEPLLYAVPQDCNEYQEAKRLLKFLDYFLGIPGDTIPSNSLIREFIGGSCFHI